MSDSDNSPQELRRKLKALLTTAGFVSQPVATGGRTMNFGGQYRDWVIFASLNEHWFHIQTVMCALPVEAGLRADVLLWMARASQELALLKYTVNKQDQILLEAQMRAELVEPGNVSNFVGFLHATAERDYLAILRLARGEHRLEALSAAFTLDSRSSVTGEGSATA
jgi:hypothetical protein